MWTTRSLCRYQPSATPPRPASSVAKRSAVVCSEWPLSSSEGSRRHRYPNTTDGIQKSVAATHPESIYSQQPSAASHGSLAGTAWAARAIPRLADPLDWLDTRDGRHHERPMWSRPHCFAAPTLSIRISSARVLLQTAISEFASPRGHRVSAASLPLYIETRRFSPCDAYADLFGALCRSVFTDESLVCSVYWQ